MKVQEKSVKQSLNKAYRLQKPKRQDIELFKTNFLGLLGKIDEKESEENVKIHLMDFLKETWYKQDYLVATKGRTDFVIHTGKDAKAPSGVLFEVKRPVNKGDMISGRNTALINFVAAAHDPNSLLFSRTRVKAGCFFICSLLGPPFLRTSGPYLLS
jgi:hypothetical protein